MGGICHSTTTWDKEPNNTFFLLFLSALLPLLGRDCLSIVSLCMAGRMQSLKSSLSPVSSVPESIDIVSVSGSQFPIHRRQVPIDPPGYGLAARTSLQLMR